MKKLIVTLFIISAMLRPGSGDMLETDTLELKPDLPRCQICDNWCRGGIYCVETWSDTGIGEESEKKKICGDCYVKIKIYIAELGK